MFKDARLNGYYYPEAVSFRHVAEDALALTLRSVEAGLYTPDISPLRRATEIIQSILRKN